MRFSPLRIFTPTNLRRYYRFIARYGFRIFLQRSWEKVQLTVGVSGGFNPESPNFYRSWLRRHEPTASELRCQSRAELDVYPVISLVVPCYRTSPQFLRALIASIQAQTYSQWCLLLSLAEVSPELVQWLETLSSTDRRIKLVDLERNLGISANTNSLLEKVDSSYVGFVDHDDTLAPNALFEVAKAVNKYPEAELLYSDEDKLSEDGKYRYSPHFKPDWSPELLRSYNYITHFLVIKKPLLDQIGPLSSECDGAQDYDLVLRATEKAKQIIHIPKILYHWRGHSESTAFSAQAKTNIQSQTRKVLTRHLKRIGRSASLLEGPFTGACRVLYEFTRAPLISIIIPNKDHYEDLKICLESILQKSSYPNYEVIIMENQSQDIRLEGLYQELRQDSRVRIVSWQKKFNYSAINNDGAREHARGEVLLFLNNDTQVLTADWLEQLWRVLQWSDVGIVGAKLYYPDTTIQHAGIVLGIGGVAGHIHKNFPKNSSGYFGRLSVAQELSAVTGACLMIKRDIFLEVGGFDENYPLAFNDVDLCLKVRSKDLKVIWTPMAELVHFESKTRGLEDTAEKIARFQKEISYFQNKWQPLLNQGDPYYNPNLTLEKENFSLKP